MDISAIAFMVHAVLVYPSLYTHEDVECSSVVVCTEADSCTAVPTEDCAGNYDPDEDLLEYRWTLPQCLESQIFVQGHAIDTLGCATDLSSADVDRGAVALAMQSAL